MILCSFQLQTRIQTFARVTETIKSSSIFTVDELKKAHQAEIADLVQKSNKKYTDMLNERMNLEDGLRAQLQSNSKNAQGDAELRVQQSNEIGRLEVITTLSVVATSCDLISWCVCPFV